LAVTENIFDYKMADNGTADILRSIHQAILSASRCFENGDVEFHAKLSNLRMKIKEWY
jgi:hypothetical protein